MSKDTVGPMITSVHPPNEPIKFIVVGAGGTGGRLIPGLMQIVKRHDSVAIVDGDHVEDRNLMRQNFRTRDVGLNKAEVMVRRYRRDGVETTAYAAMFTPDTAREIINRNSRTIVLGCVDNVQARITIQNHVKAMESAWIDGGNERRGGQVILTTNRWSFKVKGLLNKEMRERSGPYQVKGMDAMPQLLTPHSWHCDRCDIENPPQTERCTGCQQPAESCRDRIDLQTVAVNQLSASCILNTLSCLLYGVPMVTCGAFFSTLNTMSPIKLKEVRWDTLDVLTETTYASREGYD